MTQFKAYLGCMLVIIYTTTNLIKKRQLTPWNRIWLEKLIVAKIVKKFLVLH
jgi:hypothetical protein